MVDAGKWNGINTMRSLIIGMGEVGKALYQVLKDYQPDTYDIDGRGSIANPPEILHICFPYSERFLDEVKAYQEKYQPKYTVIHSSVPVGTSRQCGATHSPIRGIHPDLYAGIKQFVKFIGGEEASEVADYFRRAGLRVMLFDKSETTELMKLGDTEYYRVCIEYTKLMKERCDKLGLNFHEVYTLANQTYNEGYTQLGHPEFVRPVLQPIMKPIGGHCVMKNKELIQLNERESQV